MIKDRLYAKVSESKRRDDYMEKVYQNLIANDESYRVDTIHASKYFYSFRTRNGMWFFCQDKSVVLIDDYMDVNKKEYQMIACDHNAYHFIFVESTFYNFK